ncbi:lipopolysaccharide biosynthesis protein [Methylosinus sp. C49]|uniref:lipopolysaccharide biosynthesis protein n=1 Tax=Methylosinus sp. C49 TaxID=2699395 RepID=UPI00137B3EEF|nr:lipopolysaccharide biosynthesis protein [Methylosinus sp. C49]
MQIAVLPILVNKWGPAVYGVWALYFTVPSYLGLSDFGFATAAATRMTIEAAQGDYAQARTVYQSVWIVILCITAFIGCLSATAVALAPDDIIANAFMSASDARVILLLLLLYGLLLIPGGVLQAGFRSAGLYATGVMCNSITGLVEGAVVAGAVLAGGGLLEAAVAYLVCRLAGVFATWSILSSKAPWLWLGFREASRSEVEELFRPAIAVMPIPAAQTAFLQGTTLVLAMAGSTAAVTSFVAVRTMTRFITQAVGMVNHAILPEFSVVATREDRKGLAFFVWGTIASSLAIATPAAIVFGLFGQHIVTLWTRGALEPSNELVLVLTANALVYALWQPLSNLLLAVNRQAAYSYVYLAVALMAVVGAYPMSLWMGNVGAGLATLMLELAMTAFVAPLIWRVFLLPSPVEFLKSSFHAGRSVG